ncbi:hypothetical protein AB0G42_21500 [Streptomyces yangpuensis]|uniref:hypothetical protein n=1 Tax=Streptomyces yangpuensis TaxID=1648182 RepID=UPI0034489DF3
MPLTDSFGQNTPYPTLTDKPNAQTLGQGIVETIVPKTIMTFASAVVRGATLVTPVAGMCTYLKDVGRLELFDGGAWVTVAAGTSNWQTIDLASGFAHDGNSNGTAQYRLVNLFGEQTLMFRGGIGITYSGPGGAIPNSGNLANAPLPVAYRPASRRTIVVGCSVAASGLTALKLDVNTSGTLTVIGTNTTDAKPGWVSLNGTFVSL